VNRGHGRAGIKANGERSGEVCFVFTEFLFRRQVSDGMPISLLRGIISSRRHRSNRNRIKMAHFACALRASFLCNLLSNYSVGLMPAEA